MFINNNEAYYVLLQTYNMFNLVVSNMVIEDFKSGIEVRKAAQIFNDSEAYVDEIIEKAASNTSCQKKIKKFVHNEMLRKFREVLRKNFKFQERTMDVSMWKFFFESQAESYLRQYRRLEDDNHSCIDED